MTRTSTFFLTLALAVTLPSAALACGGFFCDGNQPVLQRGERILFIPDGAVTTTIVEIQYQGQPEDFSWLLPVPASVTASDIGTAHASLFDQLEGSTAPVFFTGSPGGATSSPVLFQCGGSSGGGGDDDDDDIDSAEVSEAVLVGQADVGPYDVSVLDASSASVLQDWLDDNGYVTPANLDGAVQPYVSAGMRFVALRLEPTRFEGVIEPISFTAPTGPAIPLVLTSVAATTNMDVVAYVLSDEQYAPAGFQRIDFPWSQVEMIEELGMTDYTLRLEEAVEGLGGRAFVTEFAGPSDSQAGQIDAETADLLAQRPYLTRMRTLIDPDDMTFDPSFVPAPELSDVDNVHVLVDIGTSLAAAPLLLLLLAPAIARRRREQESVQPGRRSV